MTTDTPVPLASRDDFMAIKGLATVVRDMTVEQVDTLMLRATRSVEAKCDRRLAPFTITETSRAEGVDPADPGFNGWPLDLIAALGRSEAMSLGTTTLVRDVWLRQYAPVMPEQWTYSDIGIELARAFGDTEQVNTLFLEGPEPDTGHMRFQLGTFCPVGTTIRVTYSGGYDPIPQDLATATLYTAAKQAIRFAELETRKGMDISDLDETILDLLVPFIRS